ncbi:uncharacterized protein VTP21DRAFT_153 [Calcarisporiella thermophila]|uniref:uncharacterized protein n=1 Tax=Calcarisporiella thermophila TaxID=911321 RepID=UPI0037446C21
MANAIRAVEKLPLSQELLDYYRQRVERAEGDYDDALARVEQIKLSHEEHHNLTWQLHQRVREIAELQRVTSELQQCITKDRSTLLNIMRENDELKVRELRDRRKIQYLLSITAPDQEENIKLKKQQDLEEVLPLPPDDADLEVKLPNDLELETLKLTVDALKAQLKDQKEVFEEITKNQEQERRVRIEQETALRTKDAESIQALTTKVQKLENFCRENTKELLHFKKMGLVRERQWREETERLKAEVKALQSTISEEGARSSEIERTAEERVSRKYSNLTEELKRQIREYEAKVQSMEVETQQKEAAQQKKIEALQKKLETMTNNYNNLNRRRKMDIEGFNNDVAMLRKQVKNLERQILKYAPADDEDIELLELARETTDQANKVAEELHQMKRKIYQAERDIRDDAI